jgi:hypothetical protein
MRQKAIYTLSEITTDDHDYYRCSLVANKTIPHLIHSLFCQVCIILLACAPIYAQKSQ